MNSDLKKNKELFDNLFLNRTFLCMENVNKSKYPDISERPLVFQCKQYTNEIIFEKYNEEMMANTNKRITILDVPVTIPDFLVKPTLNHLLQKKYWHGINKGDK
jgi:retron-type reverse transcriptase